MEAIIILLIVFFMMLFLIWRIEALKDEILNEIEMVEQQLEARDFKWRKILSDGSEK